MFSLRTSLRNLLFALLLLVAAGAMVPANAQRAVWGQQIPSFNNGGEWIPRSATDSAGNTFVMGLFKAQLSIGGFTVTSYGVGDTDVYIAKFDANGAVRWLRSAGSPQPANRPLYTENPSAIALDPQGNVFISGLGWNGFSIGALTMDSTGNFLAKLDGATGAPLWLRRLEGRQRYMAAFPNLWDGSAFHPTRLATDRAGNCYLSGHVWNLDTLANLPLPGTRAAGTDLLVAKCDGAGQFQWATQVFGPGEAEIYTTGLSVDQQGAVTFSGGLSGGPFAFGSLASPITITCTDTLLRLNSFDGFVARLAPNGTPQWVKQARGATPGGAITPENFLCQAADAAGNLYLTGSCGAGGLWLDNVPCVPPGRDADFMLKLDPQGTVLWARNDCYGNMFIQAEGLCIDPAGQPLLTGSYGSFPTDTLGPVTLPPAIQYKNMWLAGYTSQGDIRWVRTASEPVLKAALGYTISTDAAGHIYVMGVQTLAGARAVYDGHVVANAGAFVLRFDEAARITGTVYLDQNANGQRDPSETAFPRPVLVSETARPYAATSSPATGRFTVFADTGAYAVAVPQVPAYYTRTQGAAGYAGHLRTYGQTDTARVFGLAPIANRADVRVTLTPYTGARRGFVNRYRVRIENLGTTTTTGQVSVQLDPGLTYTGAVPTPAQHTGVAATWNFAGLAPFATRNFDIYATIPLNVALGTVIHAQAAVVVPNDLDATNDVDSVRQTVIGSWDPNDLTVNYTSLTPAQVAAGTVLDYTIQFQNLGTDTAFTVVITDTLAAHLLRLGTLQLVSQSHNCRWTVLGNNQLVIRFDNILLPPVGVDVLGSGGFVRFQVVPRPTLTPGMLIPNTAHIVFDFNAPISTNEVTTLVQTPNGLVAAAPAAATWSLYPNPAGRADVVTIAVPALKGRAREAAATVAVLDALGRIAITAHLAPDATNFDLDVRGLAPGLYVVRLTRPDGTATSRRLVVR